MATSSIRIGLVDDHAILRAGLRVLLGGQPDMEVVGEETDAAGALRLVNELGPDVLVMDLAMPGGGAVAAIESIASSRKGTRVLVLSMYDDPAYLRSVLAAGGAGYVAKRAADDVLITAVRAVAAGRSYVDVSVAGAAAPTRSDTPPVALDVLSAREREVLQLVALGHTNREIADQLGIGVKSVDTYRGRLADKLSLRSRAEIVRYAMDVGILEARREPEL